MEEKPSATTETQPTFDEILKNPEMQAEFDRKLESARQKWMKSWQEEAEKKQNEAQRLASMTAEEKHQAEIKALKDQLETLTRENQAKSLKDEAFKIASQKGLDASLLEIFDYGSETADSIKKKIELLAENGNKAVEKRVEERLRQSSPKNVYTNPVTSEEAYLEEKYKNNPFYKK